MIECAGLDEALHCPAVQFIAMHPLAEIVQAGVRLILPPLHHILDQVAAHIFDRIQAKADLTASIRREAAVGNIHIRRQHLDAKRAHSPEYSMTLSVLSSTLVSKAAMNSLG